MKYFRRVMTGIAVAPLLAQVDAIPQPWEPDPYWLEHKKGSLLYAQANLVLRYMKAPGYSRPILSDLPAARPILRDLMRTVGGAILGNVVVSRLRPGEHIAAHIDYWPPNVPLLYHRHQIPLRAAPGVVFRCGGAGEKSTTPDWRGEEVEMQPGEAWWFDNQSWHEVVNDSGEDRVSMFCDVAYL